jgi:hypothetical protein
MLQCGRSWGTPLLVNELLESVLPRTQQERDCGDRERGASWDTWTGFVYASCENVTWKNMTVFP